MSSWNEDEYERAAAAEMGRHAFEHEVECYGIADGQHRRPHDPAYVHWPSYLMGHRTGLAMPAEPDNGE